MRQIHKQEKEQFKKLFKQEHIDEFEDRFNILEVFLQTERHVTDKELLHLLEENGHQSDLHFVRDTLKLMCRFGFAQKNRFDNGVVRYEHRHLGQHHDHMICIKCRKIIEFRDDQIESLQVKTASAHNFHMLQHKMEIYGICSDCLKERDRMIPLVMAKQGERLIIKQFTGGTSSHMRLLTMGLRIGDRVEIVTNPSKGQMVVALDYNRLALGRGLAHKILVQPE
ncbi:transcriptional repressor [Desulfococcaceae bacterium HSG8]|nr:transcriptional repressor [Desulfococcaceae bacterium HSG8]